MDEKNINVSNTQNKLDWHKVFSSIGIILIVMTIIGAGIWYFVAGRYGENIADEGSTTKISTSSAKQATKSATKSAQKDETKDWKTYTNSQVKFSIKYTPAWKYTDSTTDSLCSADQVFFAAEESLLGKCSSGFGGIIGISRTADGTSLTMVSDNYVEKDYQNLKKEEMTIEGKKTIKISGISKVKNEVVDFTDAKEIHYIIDLGTRALTLDYRQLKDWKDFSKEFELMVSTFKLL